MQKLCFKGSSAKKEINDCHEDLDVGKKLIKRELGRVDDKIYCQFGETKVGFLPY